MRRLRSRGIVPGLFLLSGLAAYAQTTLTPTTFAFGNQAVNEASASVTATLKNTQAVALTIDSITVSGANSGDFVSGGNCPIKPRTLGAGSSCTIPVVFSPADVGSRTATLTVTHSAITSPQLLALTGTGVAPATLSAATLAFGNQAEGTTSAAKTEILTNAETSALTISNIAVSGNFLRTGGTCPAVSGTLAGGASCTILIAFNPTAVEPETGTLTVVDSAANSPQTASLTGTGITPVTITPITLNLDLVALGNTSAAKTVTLTNHESVSVSFTSIAASGNFTVDSNTCGSSVAAGATCTVGVTFSPTVAGASAGTLTFTDGSANSPQTVSLTGSGITPVTLSTSALNLGTEAVGYTSGAKTVTLTNHENVALNFASIVAGAGFSAASNSCSPSVAAGAICTVGVTFSPVATGSAAGTLTFTDNATNSPQTVSLTGTGSMPVTFAPASLAFAGYAVGTTSPTQIITVTSHLDTAAVSFTSVTGTRDFAVASNTCSPSLGAGLSCSIGIAFTPSAVGPRIGTLTIGFGAFGSPISVPLAAGPTSITVMPANPSISLGNSQQFTATAAVNGGTQNLTQAVTWTSSAAGAATIGSTALATSVAIGPTTIQAAFGPIHASTTLMVTAPALVSIAVTPANPSISLGTTRQFTATGTYTDGSTQSLTSTATWSSSATGVATINSTGLATAVAAGPAKITAMLGSIGGSTTLIVTAPTLVSIAVIPANPSISVGTTRQFTATGTYTDSSTQNLTSSVTWGSSATAFATINSAGLATGVATGLTTISAVLGVVTGSSNLVVTPPGITFFVAPNGNDLWTGTLPTPNAGNSDGPFASPAKAQLALQGLIKGGPTQPLTVMLRNGTYYLPLSPTKAGTLSFSSVDSGTAANPVTWQNYSGETPVVSGGVPLGATWQNVSGHLWQTQLPAGTQAFEYLYYNGQRRLRSRVGGSVSGSVPGSGDVGYSMNGNTCYSTVTGQPVDAQHQSLCNLGTFLRVAAEVSSSGLTCPSVTGYNGITNTSKCLDQFVYNPSDPIAELINLNPAGSQCGGASNAYPVGDIALTLFDSWTVDVMRVSCVDTIQHIIYFTGPTKSSSTGYNNFGPTAGHRYIIENALGAFNAAQSAGQTGIWFLDRRTSPGTLNYLANNGENPNTDSVVIAQLAPTLSTPGSLISAVNLSYVTFLGITFEVDNFVASSSGFTDDENGESTLPAAIDCESCQQVTFDSVIVRHTSASGLQIASASGNSGLPASNDAIQNSAFYDIGSSGIHIGHHPQGSDKTADVVQSVTVQNNIVQGYSRVFADGEGIAQGNGHDIIYLHNDITDGYHAGISICLLSCPSVGHAASGVNIKAQYNHIWGVLQGITSDGGALYYNIGGAGGGGTGNLIQNNLVHDVNDSSIIDGTANIEGYGYGGHGIYLDSQTSGVQVQNNVVYRVAASTVYVTGGPTPGQPANTFQNNILAYGRLSMFAQQTPWLQGCPIGLTQPQVNVANNIFYFDRTDLSAPRFYVTTGCADSCGLPYNQFQSFQANLYWRTDGAFSSDGDAFHVLTSAPSGSSAVSCSAPPNPRLSWTFLSFPQWQSGAPLVNGNPLQMNEDTTGTATVNPGFGNTGLPADYHLPSAPVAGFNPSATNDTVMNAGRSNPLIMPPNVPATFPTYTFPVTQF